LKMCEYADVQITDVQMNKSRKAGKTLTPVTNDQ
jgi:hypothetical protein